MNCDAITMATCMLLEGEDSVPTKCHWEECERAPHRRVCCEFSL